jgi:hypothetical protein
MTRREKHQNPISRSIKKRRDQIMKFCGPLIWLHFGDCDLECRDSSPQEFRNTKMQNDEINTRPCACNPMVLDTWKYDRRAIVALHD